MADDKWKRWISSMKTMIGSVSDLRVKASSISNIPAQFRKSRDEAYVPKVVSIGPLHRGTRRDLLHMEEIKWRCMRSLLYRTAEPEQSLAKCSEAIYALDEVVRATYADEIKFNGYDLAKIMLLDGCFLLELLITNHQELEQAIQTRSPGPGAQVGKMEAVLSDLKLLENQIPLFILILLYRELFTKDPNDDKVRKFVNGHLLFLFGCSSEPNPIESPNCGHLLELIHWFMTREKDGIAQENNHQYSITVDRNFNSQPKLKRCAASLIAAGVTIEPLSADGSMSTRLAFGCDKKFNDGTGRLEIQPLVITETKEVLWRNFIAWEQNRSIHEKFFTEEQGITQIRTLCKFSQYALFFKDLICCEHDIKVLRDQKVIVVDDEKRSNEDLMAFFRAIVDGIQMEGNVDSGYSQLINDLNAYSGGRGNGCRMLWHTCRCFVTNTRYKCRTMYVELKRDHTPTVWKTMGVIAAIVLLGLTIAQTILAAMSL
ncbi:hypothetical protein SESBI_32790 [Sesbania bispinosa]|nr:hypothetical protein SESBI_32790 [Sesbania bispinosa]